MRTFFVCFCLLCVSFCSGQDTLKIPHNSLLYGLAKGDSVTFYQCRVIDPEKEPKIATDYAQAATIMYSITDKMVIVKKDKGYLAKIYKTHMRDLPNRKFSGLKIKERPYWMFEFVKSTEVPDRVMKSLLSTEAKGQEAIEYDYAITKHTRNQVIIKHGKDFKQLLPQSNTRLVSLLN